MGFQKKFGGITIRQVELHEHALEMQLQQRRLRVQESTSSQGLNYSILTAVSIGTNYAYIGVPWSQAITLSLADARDLAYDTLVMHAKEDRAVISLVQVAGQYHWMTREYYCVTAGSLWDLFGKVAGLHSYVETIAREGVNDQNDTEKTGEKRRGKARGKRRR